MNNAKTSNKSRSWTPARRAAQAARCRAQKPWQSATGPRTRAGKDICKMNAIIHGLYAVKADTLRRLIRRQAEFVRKALRDF